MVRRDKSVVRRHKLNHTGAQFRKWLIGVGGIFPNDDPGMTSAPIALPHRERGFARATPARRHAWMSWCPLRCMVTAR